MKIKKSKLAALDFLSVSKNGYLHEDKGYISIEHNWMGQVTDQKMIKLSGLEEIEADQAGLLKMLFNFGDLTFKGQGVTETLRFVKNPRYVKRYIQDLKNV